MTGAAAAGTPQAVLAQVMDIITARHQTHGDWRATHERAADLWSAHLGAAVSAVDVAVCLGLIKLARMQAGRYEADDYADLVGYAAIAAALAGLKEAEEDRSEATALAKLRHGL